MSPSQDHRAAGRGYTLLVLTALSAMNQLDRQIMNVLIEPIRHEFALSDVQIGLMAGLAFSAIYTVLSIPASIHAARGDRRNLAAVSAFVWGAMTVACGLAQSYWQLFVARFGVGIGEAGGMPPAHAIISDLYAPAERATAMSTWSAGVNLGIFLAFLLGGLLGHFYGWRTAFFAAGGMTIGLGLLLRFTVPEPPRSGERQRAQSSTGLLTATLHALSRDRAIRHVFIGATLASIVGYGSLTWLTSFLVRSHELSIASAGAYLALVVGIGGALGTWLGGAATDRLRLRDVRWALWLVAAALIASKPFNIAFLLASPTALALALFVIPGATGAIFAGPSLAVLHNRVPAELRPIASAVFLLVVNFIGLGIGPLMIGALSQFAFAGFGSDALRYSLLSAQAVAIWGALHFYIAGGALRATSAPMRVSPDAGPTASKCVGKS
jgi:predicted MFS family arabinose efflux permease